MKRAVYLMIGMVVLTGSILCGKSEGRNGNQSGSDSVSVFATPGLVGISSTWAAEYNKLFPGAHIRVVSINDPEKAKEMVKAGNIGFASADFIPAMDKESVWSVVVGRDVLVPVVNAHNPLMGKIAARGISPADLAGLFSGTKPADWGAILKEGKPEDAELYYPGDDASVKSLSAFLRTGEGKISGTMVQVSADVPAAVQKDMYAIGFCKLADIIDPSTQQLLAGVRLFPIDRNGNGTIDFNEKIYDNANDFTRGVWIGKYPKALVNNIYTIASSQVQNGAQVAFIKWVVADGQIFLPGNGYTDLLASERQSAADKIYTAQIQPAATAGERHLLESLLFVIATTILIGVIITSLARKRKKATVKMAGETRHNVLDQETVLIPKGLYFDKTHTWAFLEENGTVKVGIDDFLQHITGKITRIKMKEPGKKVKKGEEILSIVQNGKQLNLYAPVSGTIVEQNDLLEGNSSYLNSAPYSSGWIYRIEPSNWIRESQLLFMADRQKEFIRKEFARLKDFLMGALQGDPAYAQLILQDGGEIADGVLSEMGPEVWEDFQTSFIDPSRQVWFYEMF